MQVAFFKFGIGIRFLEFILRRRGRMGDTNSVACELKNVHHHRVLGNGKHGWKTNLAFFSSSWTLNAGWATEVWYLQWQKHTMSVHNSAPKYVSAPQRNLKFKNPSIANFYQSASSSIVKKKKNPYQCCLSLCRKWSSSKSLCPEWLQDSFKKKKREKQTSEVTQVRTLACFFYLAGEGARSLQLSKFIPKCRKQSIL